MAADRVWIAFALGLVLLMAGCGTEHREVLHFRQVALDGEPNFRDVGGYVSADGRRVRWGEVYRSGELSRLSDADVGRLEALGLRTTLNFLTPQEIERHGSDRLPQGASAVLLPITGERAGALSIQAQDAIESGDFSKLPPSLNAEIHRLLLDDGEEEYAALLRVAMDPERRPLVYHCSHGVHRTGTATALLLGALGVSWDTIQKDYLLSNTFREETNAKAMARIRAGAAKARGVPESEVDMTNVEAFFVLRPEYIDGTLERAVERYGSLEAYIREGLGVTDAERDRLRDELLE